MELNRKTLIMYFLPAILVSVSFVICHQILVKDQPTRTELHEIISKKIPNYGKEIEEKPDEQNSDDKMVDEETGAVLFKTWMCSQTFFLDLDSVWAQSRHPEGLKI